MTNLDAGMKLSAGDRLGRYKVLGALGVGGMIRERVVSLLGLSETLETHEAPASSVP
jgi:hypothetical protein